MAVVAEGEGEGEGEGIRVRRCEGEAPLSADAAVPLEEVGAALRHSFVRRSAGMDYRAHLGSLGTFIRRKSYQVDKTPNELEVTKNTRLEDYGTICGVGIVILCWGGTGDVLKAINWTNKNHGYYCLYYFTCSLLIMAMGLVAARFLDTAPMPMFVAGLGAWQTMVVMAIFASYYLGVVHYLLIPEYTIFSMMATSLPFTLYWGLSFQDPSIPYKMGRVVIWIITLPCQVVVWIKSLGCKAGVWIQAKWENAGVRVRGTSAGVSSVLIFIAPS